MKHWKVKITENAERELKALLQAGELTKMDIRVLLRWVDEMEEYGPTYIATSIEWHDHSLSGDWSGYRSSAFSKAGRVIYRILDKSIVVEVYRVTTKHDYKR